MGSVHKFDDDGDTFEWEGVVAEEYDSADLRGVSVRWLIGPAEGASNFAMRYFELEPGACTSLDSHQHDHGVLVLKGCGEVLLGDEVTALGYGDAVYVPPSETHQFRCAGDAPFGFLCVIQAPRSEDQ